MILEQFNLSGKVAIVTGAAVGLGQGMAVGLAEAGADIVAVGIGSMEEVKTAVEAVGRRCLTIEANLMSIEPIQSVIDQAVEEFGHVDILVNNAGIIRREDSVQFSEKDWDDVININLKTVFCSCFC